MSPACIGDNKNLEKNILLIDVEILSLGRSMSSDKKKDESFKYMTSIRRWRNNG